MIVIGLMLLLLGAAAVFVAYPLLSAEPSPPPGPPPGLTGISRKGTGDA